MTHQRPAALTALAVGVALLVGACSPGGSTGAPAAEPTSQASPAPAATLPGAAGAGGAGTATPSTPEPPTVPVRPARDQPPPAPPAPVQVTLPALDLDLPVTADGVDEQGRMALPPSARVAAWYKFGSAPASVAGTTVISAHVDDPDGVGPFARLRDAEVGQQVGVVDAAGTTYNYTVTEVRSIPKADLPTRDLFERTGDPRLVLVTCGGTWDREQRSYTDNVLVTAVPST